MQTVLQALTTLAALLVPLATIIGLVRSRGWITLIVAFIVVALCAIAIWALQSRRRMAGAYVEIEGISIDCVNAANLRRRINRSLMVQTAEHTATIDGGDLEITWRYAGYCRARSETAMEFSIDADKSMPFGQLDCHAFDLRNDPDKQHPIQPLLIGPDSISKKIAIPFLRQLAAQEPFDLMLHCRMPNTYIPGTCYYTSTLSFDQKHVGHYAVKLRFIRGQPVWVRVYEINNSRQPKLLRALHPVQEGPDVFAYRDAAENIPATATRIYIFKLDTI
jgi:hypothetical protein